MKGHLAFQRSASNGTRLTHVFYSNTNVPDHELVVERPELIEISYLILRLVVRVSVPSWSSNYVFQCILLVGNEDWYHSRLGPTKERCGMMKYWQLSPKTKKKFLFGGRTLFPSVKGENRYDLGFDFSLFNSTIRRSIILKWPTSHSFSHSLWIDRSKFIFATYVSTVFHVPFDEVGRFWDPILHTFMIASSPKRRGRFFFQLSKSDETHLQT